MKDKFRLFKSKQFQVAQRHNLQYKDVIKKPIPFSVKLECGCIDDYTAGWYTWFYFFGYTKLEDL